jgi:two-component system chemotaxis response regulator CheY
MIPILLVDDDADMLDLMNLAFTDSGNFEVTACQDAREAVKVLKQRPIEVVISDYRMPIMNGGVFVRAARETGYKGLFIIYSGRGKDPLIDQARHDGADVYIPRSGDFMKEFSSIKTVIFNRQGDSAADNNPGKKETTTALS